MVYENVSILRVTQVYSAINRARKRDVEGAVPYNYNVMRNFVGK